MKKKQIDTKFDLKSKKPKIKKTDVDEVCVVEEIKEIEENYITEIDNDSINKNDESQLVLVEEVCVTKPPVVDNKINTILIKSNGFEDHSNAIQTK